MRKIQTEAEIDKKKKRNQVIVGVVMTFILGFSIIAFSRNGSDDGSNSGISEFGIDFFRENGLWKIALDGSVFGFQNLPSEVLDVDVNMSLNLGIYSGQPLYFVNSNAGSSEILNNIGQYVLRSQRACVVGSEDSCEEDLPVKDCGSNLIIFEDGNEAQIYQDGNCVYIVGDGVKGADAFLYELLDIN